MDKRPRILEAVARTRAIMKACRLCPRLCGVDRLAGERGFCRAPYPARVFYGDLLYGEELEICPSYEIFLTGCNMRCSFCYVARWVEDTDDAPPYGRAWLSERIDRLTATFRSVSFIGGEPTVNLLSILESLETESPLSALIWNSNMYMNEAVPQILCGIADCCIADLHFFDDSCSGALADTPEYFGHASRALIRANAVSRVIVRHLLVPGHEDCCFRPIARWMKDHLPEIPFHIMGNYHDDAGGRVSREALDDAKRFADGLGLNVYDDRAIDVPGCLAEAASGTEPGEVIIEEDGRVVIPHLTRDMLGLASDLNPRDPSLANRRNAFDHGGGGDD